MQRPPSPTAERRALLVCALTLGVVTGTLIARASAILDATTTIAVHFAILAAITALWLALPRLGPTTRATLSAVAVVGTMFFLYTSLGHVAFDAIPWLADPWLGEADRLLGLGREPALAMADALAGRGWLVEPLAFFYAAFIPYLYLSIFLSLVARPPASRRVFLLAFALLYGAAFLGYLFLPARGPIVELAGDFAAPLAGGTFHDLVVSTIAGMGGPHGAFPSLHVGASTLAMAFDLRFGDPLRGLIYLPLVAAICVATVALRYHYVVDLIAGAALAVIALEIARRWLPEAES
jgi:membrane-associated phospholipid phosphatase